MTDVGRFAGFGRPMAGDRDGGPEIEDAAIDLGLADDRRGAAGSNPSDLAARFAEALRRSRGDAAVDDPARPDDGWSAARPDDEPGDTDPDGAMVLLAASVAPATPVSPYAFVTAAETRDGPVGDAAAERIARLVETALRAEMTPTPGRPVEIALNLADLVPGLDGLTVSMAVGSIDVVLLRSADGRGLDALRAAAGGLAEGLRLRFGKRIVRVHERRSAAAGDGATEVET